MYGLIGGALLAVSLVAVGPASAAPPDAADFAADCNADGVVDVSGKQRYVGGSGTITRFCYVNMTSDATFILRGVELTGKAS